MKPFLTKIILFTTILLFILGITEYLLRIIPNDYSYKNSYYKENAKEIKIWNLGSSHAYFGIDPTYFSSTAFNGAHVSQSIKFDYYIFNKYINQMDSLKVLILPISYFTLYSNLEYGVEKWRVVNYTSYGIFLPNIRSSVRLLSDSKPFNRAIKSLLGKQDEKYCTELGMGTQYCYEKRSKDLAATAEAAVKRHTKNMINQETLSANQNYLKEICEICHHKNIKVILLTTPTHFSYYSTLNKKQLKITTKLCNELDEKYSNVTYLNWLKNNNFIDEDFYDSDHLNNKGAIKLTQLLNDYIE